ncbi:MAG: membrane protein insertase YidC [Desulfovibrionaceae bacterium]|nr:membrane protein insertase YidC [Desulfovibrionaceae bacterium]
MDHRRILLALGLSVFVLFGWQALSKFMGWTPPPIIGTLPQESPTVSSVSPSAPLHMENQAQVAAGGQDILVETPLYIARFSSNGGAIKEFTLKRYKAVHPDSGRAIDAPLRLIGPGSPETLGLIVGGQPGWAESADWSYSGKEQILLDNGETTIHFTASKDGLYIRRAYTLSADNYLVRELLQASGPTPQSLDITRALAVDSLAGAGDYMKSTKIVSMRGNSFKEEEDLKTLAAGVNYGEQITWAGAMSSYFLAAVIPDDPDLSMRALYQNGRYILLLEKRQAALSADRDFQSELTYYFGPKRHADMAAAPTDISASLEYGWFGWIAVPLLAMLKWFHSYAGNWGVSIILLTVLVKIVLWPLSYKSYKSMDEMRKLQPLMQKIREKYPDDRQRQNQEVMQLYKTYKINPMGGCLPIFVQLPVFFGLYRALLSSIELRHAGFIERLPFTDMIWLADLSSKDPLYVTPIIMGATMLFQQKMAPTSGDPLQSKMMMFMPVIFTFLFLSFPSGLVLYWLFNNIISIMQQYGQTKLSARNKN